MPRAQKGCSKPDCHNVQPCKLHPKGWGNSTRKMPSNWNSVRRSVLSSNERYNHGLCVACRARPATDVDHRVAHADGGSDDASNLVPLCNPCHKAKTAAENRARRKK